MPTADRGIRLADCGQAAGCCAACLGSRCHAPACSPCEPGSPRSQFLRGQHLADVTEIFRQVGTCLAALAQQPLQWPPAPVLQAAGCPGSPRCRRRRRSALTRLCAAATAGAGGAAQAARDVEAGLLPAHLCAGHLQVSGDAWLAWLCWRALHARLCCPAGAPGRCCAHSTCPIGLSRPTHPPSLSPPLPRLIEVIVISFLTPAGRKAAARVLRDAAASMHRLLRRL